MNEQFIRGVIFDWNRIYNNSYLKKIEAFKGVEKLDFNKSITFFVGENGSGKSTLLEALAVAHGFNPEGGTKNYVFSTHDTHSELCDAIRISKGYRKEKWGDIFLELKAFIMLQRKKRNMRMHLCEYEETESYQVTEMFINNRQRLLDRLLTDQL